MFSHQQTVFTTTNDPILLHHYSFYTEVLGALGGLSSFSTFCSCTEVFPLNRRRMFRTITLFSLCSTSTKTGVQRNYFVWRRNTFDVDPSPPQTVDSQSDGQAGEHRR